MSLYLQFTIPLSAFNGYAASLFFLRDDELEKYIAKVPVTKHRNIVHEQPLCLKYRFDHVRRASDFLKKFGKDDVYGNYAFSLHSKGWSQKATIIWPQEVFYDYDVDRTELLQDLKCLDIDPSIW